MSFTSQSHCLTPFQRKLLLKNLEADLPSIYRRRIEIMLLADEGQSQSQICKALGCSQETVRHWMIVARTGQAHNWSDRPMGRPKRVNEKYLARLKELVSNSPREYGYPFGRWTGQWLSKHLAKELGIEISTCHVNRLLKQMGLSTRGESAQTEQSTNSDARGANIVIGNIHSADAPESSETWSFNAMQPMRDSGV